MGDPNTTHLLLEKIAPSMFLLPTYNSKLTLLSTATKTLLYFSIVFLRGKNYGEICENNKKAGEASKVSYNTVKIFGLVFIYSLHSAFLNLSL